MFKIQSLKFIAALAIAVLGAAHFSAAASDIQARIINGKDTLITDVPWQAALTRSDQNLYINQYCGGSIIHAKWIVTAAHCFFDQDGNFMTAPQAGFIVAGITDLSTPNSNTEIIAIKQLVIHDGYDTKNFDNDIALLELSREIDFDVCGNSCAIIDVLQEEDQANVIPVSTPVKISGWGSLDPDALKNIYPNLLQSVNVNILDCNNAIRPSSYYSENMFCAGDYAAGTDTCAGDSGGPLVAENNMGTGFVLAGITSWGPDICATDGDPGVYTRIANYGCFIQKVSNTDVDLGLECGELQEPDSGDSQKSSSGSISWWLLSILLTIRFFPKMARQRQ